MRKPWLRLTNRFRSKSSTVEGRGQSRTGAKASDEKKQKTDRSWYWAIAVAGAIIVLHLVLFPPLPRIESEFPVLGEIVEQEIRAPFAFEAPYLTSDVEAQRHLSALAEPPVLRRLQDSPGADQELRFTAFLDALRGQLTLADLSVDERISRLNLQFPFLTAESLRHALEHDDVDELIETMLISFHAILAAGVVDRLPHGTYSKVWVVDQEEQSQRDLATVVPQVALGERLTTQLSAAGKSPLDAVWAASLLRHFVTPNLVYDSIATRERQDQARHAVPAVREFITGERIVDQGVRVTEEQDVFLDHLYNLLVERGNTASGERFVRFLTRILLVALALGLYGWIGYIHFPDILRRLRLLIALASSLALFLVGAAFALGQSGLGPFAVPISLLSLLATVLFKDRVGYGTTLLAVTLLGILPETTAVSYFILLVLGVVTVIAVRRIRKRSQFYQTIGLLTLLSVILISIVNVAAGENLMDLGGVYLIGLFTPILSVALALFLLPVVEPIVGVSSDLTLLELSDLNHPLLKRMALEAQGTYHHSQVVGQLAEQAARAIDANPLLTRVGALFHDLGKLQKPDYYVENQRIGDNKHDELSPSMSALIISAHVKDGIEMAKKWRLPQAVIDFIPEHHGTNVMEYFYHKALEGDGNETVKVDDFRYPGPKPRSRETAILMLADAVEAATRSLGKPTPSRIKEITKQIVDKRMLSGELDESNVTLSDLANIRKSFIPLLTGIHHARIVYPGQKDREVERSSERKSENKAERRSDRKQESRGDRKAESKSERRGDRKVES